tara:strand:- start:1924 stop:3033 length:1110 start_codon:yes stop_codon:yes gene_type:complete
MIQAITETDFKSYIQTEDNRIDTSVGSSLIRHLVKFTNDMDDSVQYAYASVETINNRYTEFQYLYSPSPDVYTGKVNLLPAGFWKYEYYEVSWEEEVIISNGFAPATETDVLTPAAVNKGVVQGLVTKGKMYVAEKSGTEEVQYTQHTEPSGTNYIYYGQGWQPTDEGADLGAWYRKGTLITLSGVGVSSWGDSGTFGVDMVQATTSEQPSYSSGVLTFNPTNTQNLQSSSQISIAGAFTIGFKATPTSYTGTVIADNTTAGEFIRYNGTSKIRVQIDAGTAVDLDLDSGTWGADYIVITRDGSNLLNLYVNGVKQADSGTLAGTSDIDTIGVRRTDQSPFDGTIEEIMIFRETSATLVANINTRLASL